MKKATLKKRETLSIMLDSDVLVVKETAMKMAREAGFCRNASTEVAIAAAELCTNIVKHAGSGHIHFQISEGDETTMTIAAEDRGPGIACHETAMKDYHTDRGSVVGEDGFFRPMRQGIGCGLSAVKRLMDHMEINSSPGAGTVVIVRKSIKRSAESHRKAGHLTRQFHAK